MPKPVPEKVKRLVVAGRISFSAKAIYQLFWRPFEFQDLAHPILVGEVIRKERDERGVANFKYTVIGQRSVANGFIRQGESP
ncbi:MAG: hypothetical protein RMM98_08840 [Acidobacteriota bacterium]|nr:hypothetical protein [Blastocatellia bacterium]MDW8239710.1 hypothetical protein [Acidobacteriota bacterium]